MKDNEACFISLRPNDVICGKMKLVFAHSGNETFRTAIALHARQYQETRVRREKRMTTDRVFEIMVKSHNSRFLRRDDLGLWYEVNDRSAKQKISLALRDWTPRKRAKKLVAKNQKKSHSACALPKALSPSIKLQLSIGPNSKVLHDASLIKPSNDTPFFEMCWPEWDGSRTTKDIFAT